MSALTILQEQVIALTNQLNAIITNSKQTQELPEQTSVDLNSKIRVTKNGVSEWLTVQSIIDQTSVGLFKGVYADESALNAAHAVAASGNWAIVTVVSGDNQVWHWDGDESNWFFSSNQNNLKTISVTASRDFNNSDIGKLLVIAFN